MKRTLLLLCLLIVLLVIASSAALSAPDSTDRLNDLASQLNDVRQEQQSVYQNYQMTREARRLEVQEGSPPMAQHPYGLDIYTPPPGYDDVLREQQAREQRIQQYTDELRGLSARYLELERQRKSLLRQIEDLKQQSNG